MNNNNLKNAFPNTPNNFKNRVKTTLNSLPEKEEYIKMESKTYKKISFKKKLVVAVAATFVLGTTAFAAGKLYSTIGHSSAIPTYRNMPTVEEINEDFGFEPALVENFENGYEFKSGHTSNNEGFDESGNSLGKSKSLGMVYTKDKNQVWINVEDLTLVSRDDGSLLVDNYKNADLYYLSYTNKLVPGDYEMTEQDKADEKSGKYIFSFGSEEIETSEIQHLSFELEGIYYSLMVRDSDLTKDDLVAMAKEIIDNK